MTDLEERILLTNLDKKLTRNMEKIPGLSNKPASQNLMLGLADMEPRINIKSCRKLISGIDEAQRGPHGV